MHLLTTYCQDTMANFGCMRIRSIIYQFFRAVFQNVLKCNIFSLNACEACNFPTETTNHKFYECPAMKSFWNDAFNWWNLRRSENITPSATEILYTVIMQRKQCSIDSPGLVDFAIWLVNSVLNLPNGQVKYFEEFNLQRNCEINSAHQKILGAR